MYICSHATNSWITNEKTYLIYAVQSPFFCEYVHEMGDKWFTCQRIVTRISTHTWFMLIVLAPFYIDDIVYALSLLVLMVLGIVSFILAKTISEYPTNYGHITYMDLQRFTYTVTHTYRHRAHLFNMFGWWEGKGVGVNWGSINVSAHSTESPLVIGVSVNCVACDSD